MTTRDLELLSPDTLWAMTPGSLEAMLHRLDGAPLRAPDDWTEANVDAEARAALISKGLEPLDGTLRAARCGSVAILPVYGPIRPRGGGLLSFLRGGTSLVSLAHDFEAALEDGDITAIVFDVDSPGGQVTGVDEFADLVMAARGRKRMVAHCGGGLMASAAYWIGSAADEVVLSRIAEAGSIGVLASFLDFSKFDERVGIREITIVSSQSPNKNADPSAPSGRELIQTRIDAVADVFVDQVAAQRGVSRDLVLSDFGQGDLVVGEGAVAVGLADRLATLEVVVSELTEARAFVPPFQSESKGNPMSEQNKGAPTAEQLVGLTPEQLRAHCPEAVSAIEKDARAAGATAERERIKAIEDLSQPGLEAFVAEAKYDPEKTPEQVAMEGLSRLRNDPSARLRGEGVEPLGHEEPQEEPSRPAGGSEAAEIDPNVVYGAFNAAGRPKAS